MVEETKSKASLKKSGGSNSSFQMQSVPIEKPTIANEIDKELEADVSQADDGVMSQLAIESNAIVVETTVKLIGKTAEMVTRIPEMNFDQEEVEQLKTLWSPIMPEMSPVTAAIFGTVVIVAGKVAIYSKLKKERDKERGE